MCELLDDEYFLLMAADVAALLNRPIRRIYEMARRGEIEHVRDGDSIRFRPEAVERWIDAHTIPVIDVRL